MVNGEILQFRIFLVMIRIDLCGVVTCTDIQTADGEIQTIFGEEILKQRFPAFRIDFLKHVASRIGERSPEPENFMGNFCLIHIHTGGIIVNIRTEWLVFHFIGETAFVTAYHFEARHYIILSVCFVIHCGQKILSGIAAETHDISV